MTSNFQVLVDSDAFVGLMIEKDAHHKSSQKIFKRLRAQKAKLLTTSLVVVETATVLSHRVGQDLARAFLVEVVEKGGLPVTQIIDDLYEEALKIFKDQTKKGTSVTDCANVAILKRLNIPEIFSFDKVYSKSFGLQMISD